MEPLCQKSVFGDTSFKDITTLSHTIAQERLQTSQANSPWQNRSQAENPRYIHATFCLLNMNRLRCLFDEILVMAAMATPGGRMFVCFESMIRGFLYRQGCHTISSRCRSNNFFASYFVFHVSLAHVHRYHASVGGLHIPPTSAINFYWNSLKTWSRMPQTAPSNFILLKKTFPYRYLGTGAPTAKIIRNRSHLGLLFNNAV